MGFRGGFFPYNTAYYRVNVLNRLLLSHNFCLIRIFVMVISIDIH
jgi:hypothetical protein